MVLKILFVIFSEVAKIVKIIKNKIRSCFNGNGNDGSLYLMFAIIDLGPVVP
jgi:hypothetical protein